MENIYKREWSAGYIIEHWVRVISIVVLTFTGLYIHWPFIAGGPESFIMAWMRFCPDPGAPGEGVHGVSFHL